MGKNSHDWPHADKFIIAWRKAGFRIIGHLAFPKRYTSSERYCGITRMRLPARQGLLADACRHHRGRDWTYNGNKLHPTQKPLSVLLPIVETFSYPQGVVLDSFSDSVSSWLAAKILGRSYFGIEIDAEYHAISLQRFSVAS